jgi:filamentous hemagglutinin family protein
MIKPIGIDPIAKLVGSGIVSSIVLLWTSTSLAQLRPIADETLGDERTIVTPLDPDFPVDRIDGGARRGNNLFHSFQNFQVDAGRGVYFTDPGVDNILGRVTGGIPSRILGTLGVLGGDANLFLINPNGIIFGENARLDIGGSFVATTANAIGFGDQGWFDVADPNAPPLLTVQPSAFLFNRANPGAIENRSRASLGDDGLGNDVFGLDVPNGQNLVLLGGTVINRGDLNAFGGRVELGSVGGLGTVGLAANGSLSFPNEITRADVRITNDSRIDVASDNGGNIVINARNIDVSGGSFLRAGIFSGLGTVDSQAGDIVLNGTGEIQVRQLSLITNNVGANGIGSSGNVHITAGSLFVREGSSLQALTRGRGDAGNVIIRAGDRVVFDGASADGRFPSAAFSTVGAVDFNGEVVGNGGNVEIYTDSLEIRNGAQLQAATFGLGNAGNVIVEADDRVVFDDGNAFSTVERSNFAGEVIRDGGDIRIYTGSLEVRRGASLEASTFGQGNAGNVFIRADDHVVFDDSGAFTRIEEGGIGTGGSINIVANTLVVRNSAQLIASTNGTGNAGNVLIRADDRVVFDGTSIAFSTVRAVDSGDGAVGNGGNVEIYTDSLEVRNGAQLQAATFGKGDAGNVIIEADDRVVFDGTSANGEFSSAAFSTVGDVYFNDEAVGNGGNVEIYTDSLEVRNGAQLQAATFGLGNAGNVIVEADDRVVFDGTSANGFLPSAAFSTVGTVYFNGVAVGNGGNVEIYTDSLEIRNGAQLQAATFGLGNAGNVIVEADDRVVFDDGDAFSSVEAGGVGIGGDINIDTDALVVRNGAQLLADSTRQGRAGNINITSRSIQLDRGRLTAETRTGDGGNITLDNVDLLQLRNGSLISTTAGTARSGGDGGNIAIDSDFIVAVPNENSDIRANAFSGSGGNVTITTQGLLGIEPQDNPTDRSDITASSDLGVQGTIAINTPDIDPSRGLTELPDAPVDASNQIAQACPTSGNIAEALGEFIVTGRGGLPANPTELLSGDTVLPQLSGVPNEGTEERVGGGTNPEVDQLDPVNPPPIVEAQGWQIDSEGNVALIAATPAQASAFAEVQCQSSN